MKIIGKICGTDVVSEIEINDGKIRSIENFTGEIVDNAIGGTNFVVSPALIDIQVNGSYGYSINSDNTTAQDIAEIAKFLWKAGVGLFCPTVTTGSFKLLANSFRAITDACKDGRIARSILPIHLEGPYISPEDGPRGAHKKEFVRNPDWDEFQKFQDLAEGEIGIVTLAPERPGAIEFIEKLVKANVIPAIGHTDAKKKDIDAAIKAGAKLSTHLGNGAHAMMPRHPNYIWEQLAADELWVSIIVDGHHLPPSVVKCMIRCKGLDKTILVSDAIVYAGKPPGTYDYTGRVVEVTPEKKVLLKGTPYLAGSALELFSGVEDVIKFSDVSLREAVDMASINPAKLLGISNQVGSVEVGKDASLLIFQWNEIDKSMDICYTIVEGKIVYGH